MNQSSIFVPVRFLSEYREKWAHRDVKSVISFNQNPSLKSSRIWSVSCCWNRVAGFLRRRGLNLRNLFLKKCKFVATALTLKYPDGLALDQDARRKTQDVEAEERATKLITSFPWDWKSSSIQRDVVGYSRGCRNYQIDSLLTPKSIFRKEICYIITFHRTERITSQYYWCNGRSHKFMVSPSLDASQPLPDHMDSSNDR